MRSRTYVLAVATMCAGLQLLAPCSARGQDRSLGEMLPDYSRCIVKAKPRQAREFVLSSQVVEAGGRTEVKAPTSARCSYVFAGNDQVRFVQSWYRDELAYYLLMSEPDLQDFKTFVDKAKLIQPPKPTRGGARYGYERMEYNNAIMGECVARSAPEKVRAWLTASANATSAQLNPWIDNIREKCARELGSRFESERLQAPVARGYYRLAHAPSLPIK